MRVIEEESGMYVLDTDDMKPATYPDDTNPFSNRDAYDRMMRDEGAPKVTLVFIAYNNLEKYTKPAMEALLKYTSHIDMELVLVDNGSSDGTWEFFQRVEFPRKRVCRVTKNVGAAMAMVAAGRAVWGCGWGRYLCTLPNDILVTEHWLDNLLACMDSDERIGVAVPLSNYASNYQGIDLQFSDMEEMQEKAAAFNQSDPGKWEERIRVIPTTVLIRSSLYRIWQQDHALIYYFSDDDLSFQYRRMGYKLMVCGDTFVYHDGSLALKDPEKYNETLRKGRSIFRQKYFGIDPWEDTMDLNTDIVPLLMKGWEGQEGRTHHALGVDVQCGQPLLSIRNHLRRHGGGRAHLSAYTEDPKYWMDLKSVCDGEVVCRELPREGAYDEILLGERINRYVSMEEALGRWLPKLKAGGRLAFRYVNYPVTGYFPVSFPEIEGFLRGYPHCRIKEINIDPLRRNDFRQRWEMLRIRAGRGDIKAMEEIRREFADSYRFQNYAVGEIIIVLERLP